LAEIEWIFVVAAVGWNWVDFCRSFYVSNIVLPLAIQLFIYVKLIQTYLFEWEKSFFFRFSVFFFQGKIPVGGPAITSAIITIWWTSMHNFGAAAVHFSI